MNTSTVHKTFMNTSTVYKTFMNTSTVFSKNLTGVSVGHQFIELNFDFLSSSSCVLDQTAFFIQSFKRPHLLVPDFLFCFSKHLRDKVVPTNRKAPSLLFIFRAPMHHYSSVNLQLTSEIPEFIPPQREEGWRDGGGMEDQCQFGSNIDTIKIPFWYRYIIGTLYIIPITQIPQGPHCRRYENTQEFLGWQHQNF